MSGWERFVADWQAGAVVLGSVLVVWGLMYVGWRSRGRRQRALAAPQADAPAGFTADLLAPTDGIYVSTVRAGDWLDRVVAHGLGARSTAVLSAGGAPGAAGVQWRRQGAPDVFVPACDLVGVRLGRGQAGKFTAEPGIVVLTWRLGGDLVDTAFRPRERAAAGVVEQALARLVPVAGPGTGGAEAAA